jgi:hypothetical protein
MTKEKILKNRSEAPIKAGKEPKIAKNFGILFPRELET